MAARLFVSKDATNFGGINYNGVTNQIEIYTSPPYTARISINPTTGLVSIPNLSTTSFGAHILVAAGSSVSVPIATVNTFTRINSGFTSGYVSGFTLTNARAATYNGTATRPMRITCDVSFTNTSLLVSDLLQFAVIKNATVNANNEYTAGTIFNPQNISGFTSTNSGNASLGAIDPACAPNDVYTVFVKNTTDTTNILCSSCNLAISSL